MKNPSALPPNDPVSVAARKAWEDENGRKAGPDDYYDTIYEEWVHFLDNEDMDAIRERHHVGEVGTCVMPDSSFVSISLPKNYTIHKELGGRFTKDGSVIIDNRRQLDRLVEHGNANGEKIAYAGSGRQHYCD